MKNVLLSIIVLFLLVGCTGGVKSDKVLQIDGVSENLAPDVLIISEDNKINITLDSSVYEQVTILEPVSLAISSCDKSPDEALLGVITKTKPGCIPLICSVDSLAKVDSSIYLTASCNKPIAEKGKMYLVYLNMSAEVPKNSMFGIVLFPSCTINTSVDICEAEYTIAATKS